MIWSVNSSAVPVALLALSALACSGDGIGPSATPQELQIVSGDGQEGASGAALADPLRVRVIGSNEEPVGGVTVHWSATQGQVTVEPAQSTTNSAGEAETRITLGPTAGAFAVRASVGDLAPVTFSLTSLDPSAFTALSAGYGFTCALTAAGAAYCWGRNDYGQFGDGTRNSQSIPVPVSGGLNFVALSAGAFHACGVTAGGVLYCWGDNRFYQLGDGTTSSRLSPVPVAEGLSFLTVSASGESTCGVTASEFAYCWGENPYGVLGDGSTVQQRTPSVAAGGVKLTAIGPSSLFTCGLTAAGLAYCWGGNAYGQLGDGTTTARATAVPVSGDLRFTTLSSSWGGWNHTCGLTATGAAFCWGLNGGGQLGDGTATDRLVPVAVEGGLSFAGIDAGAGHTCGVTAEGTAYCWGSNGHGDLGNGTTTDHSTPVPVAGGLTLVAVSAGLEHTCALTADGEAYCWGSTSPGEGAPPTLTPTLVVR
jgi:alpha-tubulin suppressor-like RCC1 family protein